MGGVVSTLIGRVVDRQAAIGGWSFTESHQLSVEATCLAVLAVLSNAPHQADTAFLFLSQTQLRNGGWPCFPEDPEPSWTTALVLSTLSVTGKLSAACESALRWLLEARGKESHWFWRWKFKTADRNVRFDPDKYGWPWTPGAGSWVIPTAFSLIAIKQFTVCDRREASEKRIRLGVEMLLDRACFAGGWNTGNSVVYGMPLRAHAEATAIALLALQDEPRGKIIDLSLLWLTQEAATIESVSSLAWCILCLFVYQKPVEELKKRLADMVKDGSEIRNNATLATALLALRCGEMIHPFLVAR